MIALTAIIKIKAGHEEAVKAALLKVAAYVATEEPDTISFYLGQDAKDPTVFTTYERFRDLDAMERHNGSDIVAAFFAVAKPVLDGEVVIKVSEEFSAK